MLEILWLIILTTTGIFGGIFLLNIIDSIRFKDVNKLRKNIQEHYLNRCLKVEKTHLDLSDKEKIFVEDLKNYLKCQNLNISQKIYLRDLFCVCIENDQFPKLKELMFYTQDNYYCVNDVYLLYNFIEEKFIEYLNRNISVSATELNIKLLGSDNLNEDEVIDKLLNMTSYEFIKKFTTLI